jgi:hypothetical protein
MFCRSLRTVALLLVAVTSPSMVDGQTPRWGIAGGGATNSWSGPYQEGGRLSPALAVWAEMSPTSRWALRAEAGAGSFAADFGDATTLTLYQVHLGAFGRRYSGDGAHSRRWFVEAGSAAWRRTSCDVDTVGGGAFLGGSTETCKDWRPALHVGDAPLTPRSGGAVILAGAGARLARFGVNARYAQVVGSVLETSEENLRVRQYLLVGEWTIGR